MQPTAESRRREAIITRKLIVTCALAAGLSACSGPNYKPEAASAATPESKLPVPSVQDMTRDQADYRIGPLDKLTVTVFGVPDLTTNGQVDGAGNLTMPLIGQVKAIGETPNSLSTKIAAALDQRYVRNPQVSVTVTEAVSALVTVEGSVIRPGQYPVIGRTTLIRMVAAAGGPSDYARLSEAVVFRTVNGQKMVARFNIKDIRGARSPDPEIYGNDVIVIGNNSARQLFKDVISVAPVIGIFYQIAR
jgi:polysaccharide export outer membrane protein